MLRYEIFALFLTKSTFNLASLPPTEEAARQHSLRTYLQVQAWKSNPLDPLQWGWKISKPGLQPIPTTKEAAPEELLKTICCACSKGYHGGRTCRKNGMKCTTICKFCKGHSCTNSQDPFFDSGECDIDFDDIMEEQRGDLYDDLYVEEMEELE